MSDAQSFIRAHLPVTPVPGIVDVHLHKAGPSSGVGRWAAEGPPPYWAFWWAGGLALAQHLQACPALVAGRRVLDLGAGSGLVAIVAARMGAAGVAASEVDAHGRAAIALNATLNGVILEDIVGDVMNAPSPGVDVILAGDLFYAPDVAARVVPFLDGCVASGIEVLVGDPGRSPLPRDRLTFLARYQVAETSTPKPAAVYAYRGAGPYPVA